MRVPRSGPRARVSGTRNEKSLLGLAGLGQRLDMTRAVLGRQRAEATALPNWVKPQLAKLVDQPPDGPGWLHEIKFDGYRMHARLDRGVARLLTRTGVDCPSTDRPHRRCRAPAR